MVQHEYLIAEVAKTCPFDPTLSTTTDATTTIRSAPGKNMQSFVFFIIRDGFVSPICNLLRTAKEEQQQQSSSSSSLSQSPMLCMRNFNVHV